MNFLWGFTYLLGDIQIAPNFLWQKPIEGPIPNTVPAPGRPRNILVDPFVVRANREQVAGEILFTYDPTPGTWMYDWDSDRQEDAGLAVNTNWKKYYIPIPDPSKLKNERGMFFYSEGPENGRGYTFWIDEVKFENLGTIAHPSFAILNGENQTETSFTGVTKKLGGLTATFNLPAGTNQIVNASPAFFSFSSSDQSIAKVDEFGNVTVLGGPGSAEITAKVGDIAAKGSLRIQSVGTFEHAPTPTHPAANVISIFSDAYVNVPVDFYNGYWAPWQTTLSADFVINGDHILHYTDFNFVGIQFSSPPVNANTMTHFHMDIYLPNQLTANAPFRVELVDNAGGGTGTYTTTIQDAQSQQWISLDIPLSSFAGLSSRTSLWQIIFVDVNGNIPSFYADNIYFYR